MEHLNITYMQYLKYTKTLKMLEVGSGIAELKTIPIKLNLPITGDHKPKTDKSRNCSNREQKPLTL